MKKFTYRFWGLNFTGHSDEERDQTTPFGESNKKNNKNRVIPLCFSFPACFLRKRKDHGPGGEENHTTLEISVKKPWSCGWRVQTIIMDSWWRWRNHHHHHHHRHGGDGHSVKKTSSHNHHHGGHLMMMKQKKNAHLRDRISSIWFVLWGWRNWLKLQCLCGKIKKQNKSRLPLS